MAPSWFHHGSTPMSERLLAARLKASGEVALQYRDNHLLFSWRCREMDSPRLARLMALFRFGPRIAYGWPA